MPAPRLLPHPTGLCVSKRRSCLLWGPGLAGPGIASGARDRACSSAAGLGQSRTRRSPGCARPRARDSTAEQSASLAAALPLRPGDLEFPEAEVTRGEWARQHPATLGSTPSKGSFPASGTSSNPRASPNLILSTSWHPGFLKSFLKATCYPVDRMAPFYASPPTFLRGGIRLKAGANASKSNGALKGYRAR